MTPILLSKPVPEIDVPTQPVEKWDKGIVYVEGNQTRFEGSLTKRNDGLAQMFRVMANSGNISNSIWVQGYLQVITTRSWPSISSQKRTAK